MEHITVFLFGAALYAALETLWRGWTHWTMLICGGLCFLMMYMLSRISIRPWRKCVLSAAGITVAEYFTGCLVNIRLGWAVWDYSQRPLNLSGQICASYCLLWLLLSVPGLWLCTVLRRRLSRRIPR